MAENGKPTVASDWLTGCAGCHMSLLDIDERIVDIVTAATLWSTPITDLKHPPEEGVTVGILEGGVNNSTTEEVAKMMRARSKILMALGDCAVFGGVPSMRNACGIQEALQRAYVETESTVDGQIPSHPDIAVMQETRPLDAGRAGRHLPAGLSAQRGCDFLRARRAGKRPHARAQGQIPGLALRGTYGTEDYD